MNRDSLWECTSATPQLEFIVDSLTVAKVVNMQASCDNAYYRPAFDRMITKLAGMYDGVFQHKAGYLATHDWRPREWNLTADRLCNISLDLGRNLHHVFIPDLAGKLHDGRALQVYSD